MEGFRNEPENIAVPSMEKLTGNADPEENAVHKAENERWVDKFSPKEELARIRGQERGPYKDALLQQFKERLATQREVIASCRTLIEREIESNNDIPKNDLYEQVSKFGEHYALDDQAVDAILYLIDRYYEQRKKVLEMREQFPDDAELVRELGLELADEEEEFVKVSVGPMTIDIETLPSIVKKWLNKGKENTSSTKFVAGGFAGFRPVPFTVTNGSSEMRQHEHEHHKNRLFKEMFDVPVKRAPLSDYENESDPEVKGMILKDTLQQHKTHALQAAKDEIIAQLVGGVDPGTKLVEKFTVSSWGPYDYLMRVRDYKSADTQLPAMVTDPLYIELGGKMIREYKEIILNAVSKYEELIARKNINKQHAIALLTDKSLNDWPKTIDRMLEQEK